MLHKTRLVVKQSNTPTPVEYDVEEDKDTVYHLLLRLSLFCNFIHPKYIHVY